MKYIVYILIFFGLLSCLPEDLPITDIPQAESRITVSSIVYPGDSLAVIVTRSVSALDEVTNLDIQSMINKIAIQDANVFISSNSRNIKINEVYPGIYATSLSSLPQSTTYQLTVQTEDQRASVVAATEYLREVPFIDVSASAVKAAEDSLAEISFTLFDPAGTPNWYMVSVQPFSVPQFDFVPFADEDVFTHLTSDNNRDGSLITESFTALDFGGYDIGDTILVSLANISKDYYEFLDARENDQIGVEFLYEPYNFPSNVTGGYGLFTLHKIDYRLVIVR